ncbi:MAG TPA: sigma-70 family RNA polymerase sigma factor [Terracidiphilus sp.]|nr:sigma-70 family RNA polymerase sigma factor [Terracidiphilus sp.]
MSLLPWRKDAGDAGPEPVSFGDMALPLLPALYNFARWLTREGSEAEDLVQETMLKALRGFSSFEPGTNFKAWIFRILRNTYLTSRSGLAAMRTVSLEEEQVSNESGIGGHLEATIDRRTPEIDLLRLLDNEMVRTAMQKLPPHLLEVTLLCNMEEMKYREISIVLGIPIGTVMSRLARARASLRQELMVLGFTRLEERR